MFYNTNNSPYKDHNIIVIFVKIGYFTNKKGYFYAQNTNILKDYIKTDVSDVNNIKKKINDNIYKNKFNIAEKFNNHFEESEDPITQWAENQAKEKESKLSYFGIPKKITKDNEKKLREFFNTKNYNTK